MLATLAAFALLPALSLATIDITSPSSSVYWVQNTSNTIRWTFESGDPEFISIFIVNADNATLNGPFSIQEYVPVTNESFTVTDVTLLVGSSYTVEFANVTNNTQIFANSSTFDVKAPGTAAASDSATASTATAPVSSSTGSAGSSSGSSSASSSAASSTSSNAASEALFKSQSGLVGLTVAAGIVALSGLLL